MAADNNNDVKHNQPPNQGGGGKGGKAELNAAAAAPADEGDGGYCNNNDNDNDNERSGSARSIHHASTTSNIGNDLKLKRRRLQNNIPAPAARFIQEYNDNEYPYAYISDHGEDEREYLPKAIRRKGEGDVVHKLQQQIQRQEQGQESAAKIEETKTKNEASTLSLSLFAGRKRNARCYCFNCW